MIIFLDSQGSLVNKQPSKIYQGSNKANEIYVVAPIPKASQVLAYFTLPNSTVTKPRYVKAETETVSSLNLGDKTYGVWYLSLDTVLTAYHGQASVQFYFVSRTSETLTSESISFEIFKGVAPIKQEDISDTQTLEDVLSLVSDIYTRTENLNYKIDDTKQELEADLELAKEELNQEIDRVELKTEGFI